MAQHKSSAAGHLAQGELKQKPWVLNEVLLSTQPKCRSAAETTRWAKCNHSSIKSSWHQEEQGLDMHPTDITAKPMGIQ